MKSLKIRLELTDNQLTACRKHAGVARHAYNWGVAQCQRAFEAGEKTPSAIDLHKRLVAEVKPVNAFYYEVSKCAPQQALRNLETAFKHFHRIQKATNYSLKKTVRRKGVALTVLQGLPKFKRKGHSDGFLLERSTSIPHAGQRINLPRFGWVRLAEAVPANAVIKSVSITRRADHWYIAFQVPHTPVVPQGKRGSVGVDLGIKTLATLSDGTVFPAVRPYKANQRKLKLAQRRVSKKYVKNADRQSANYVKASRKVARIHARIAHIRTDALHKLTTHLAKNHSRVVIEDLNVRGMSKNHRLASAILDGGFFELRRQLTYKGGWYGCEVVVANRWFASSKTCSSCGQRKKTLSLSQRTYHCAHCGLQLDRDLNRCAGATAINLNTFTASYAGSACGATTHQTDLSERVATKQEANSSLGHVQVCVGLA